MRNLSSISDDRLLALVGQTDPASDTPADEDALWQRISADIADDLASVPTDTPRAPRTTARRHRRLVARVVLVIVLLGVVTVAALAATGVWNPTLGEPGGAPAGTSTTPVPAAVLDTLGVLRRPQTAADRGPTAETLLHGIGPEGAGVRLGSIRLVTQSDGQSVVIYSQQRGINPVTGATQSHEPICIITPPAPGAWSCASLAHIRAHGLTLGAGGRVVGVVPDGIASVELTYPDGATHHASVEQNLFTDQAPNSADPTPPATPGHAPPPAPPSALPAKVEWLDAQGSRVGGS